MPGSFVCWGPQAHHHNSYPRWIIRPSPWPEKREPEPLRNFFSLKKALPVAQINALDSATAVICPHRPSQAYPTSSNKGIPMDSLSLVSKRSKKMLPCAISVLSSLSHVHPSSAPCEVWVGASRKAVTMTHQQNTFHLLRKVRHGRDINGMCQLFHPWATCQLDVLPCLKENIGLKFEETYWMTSQPLVELNLSNLF